jgi:hypothetical protein
MIASRTKLSSSWAQSRPGNISGPEKHFIAGALTPTLHEVSGNVSATPRVPLKPASEANAHRAGRLVRRGSTSDDGSDNNQLRFAKTVGFAKRSTIQREPDGQITWIFDFAVQSSSQKYSASRSAQINFINFASRPERGALAIVTNVGAGCGGR